MSADTNFHHVTYFNSSLAVGAKSWILQQDEAEWRICTQICPNIFLESKIFFLGGSWPSCPGPSTVTRGVDIDFRPVWGSLTAKLSAFNIEMGFKRPHIWTFCVLTVSRFLFQTMCNGKNMIHNQLIVFHLRTPNRAVGTLIKTQPIPVGPFPPQDARCSSSSSLIK